MATLAQYKNLPNVVNGVYGLKQLQMAIALSDVWQLNNLGMATLAQYKTLPNLVNGTYSLKQLQMAIALSDVWQLDGLGGNAPYGFASLGSDQKLVNSQFPLTVATGSLNASNEAVNVVPFILQANRTSDYANGNNKLADGGVDARLFLCNIANGSFQPSSTIPVLDFGTYFISGGVENLSAFRLSYAVENFAGSKSARAEFKTTKSDGTFNGGIQLLENGAIRIGYTNRINFGINPTFISTLDVNGNVFAKGQYFTTRQSFTPTGTTQTIDWDNGSFVNLILSSATGNVTLTLNNPKITSYVITVINGATPRNLIFPSGTVQSGARGNIYTGTANQSDLIAVTWDGLKYWISVTSNYA